MSSYLQTSTTVASVLYQLALHPEKQDLAYDEVCNVLPQRDTSLEVTNIDNLKYLKACIKETLRFVKIKWITDKRCTCDSNPLFCSNVSNDSSF